MWAMGVVMGAVTGVVTGVVVGVVTGVVVGGLELTSGDRGQTKDERSAQKQKERKKGSRQCRRIWLLEHVPWK